MTKDNPATTEVWGWFEGTALPASEENLEAETGLTLAAARCLRGADGKKVLAYLRAITLERTLGPGASDTLLRHLEGQRQLVAHIILLVERGRDGG